MKGGPLRQRYFLFVSAAYVALGLFILVRSITAQSYVVTFLGVVFIALGLVRLRDFLKWRRMADGS